MHPVAIFDIITIMLCLIALVIMLKSSTKLTGKQEKIPVAILLVFTLFYSLCMTLEWTGFNLRLNPIEDVLGALIPMLWAFVFYALLKGISEHDLKKAHKKLEEEILLLEQEASQRRKAQSALEESESRYRALFEGAPDAIFLSDPDTGLILDANPAAFELLKMPKEKVIGMHHSKLHPPDKQKEVGNIFKNHSNGIAEAAEVIIIRSDGKEIPVEVLWHVIPLKGKKVVQGVFRDITERKHSEEILQQNEAFLQNAFTAIQDGISILDKDLKVQYTNQVMQKWYATNMPLIGKKCHVCYHNNDEPCDPCPTIKCLKTGNTESDIVPGLAGSPIEWLELYSYPLKNPDTGKITGVIEFVRDISKRKKAEQELKKERDKAQQYLDVAGTIFIVLDRNGCVALVNKKGCYILEYNENEIVGKNWFENFLPQSILKDVRDGFKKLMNGEIEAVEYFENPVISKSGKEKIIAWHNTVLRDDNDNIIGTLSSGEDVTERKLAEKEIIERQQQLKSLTSELAIAEEQERRRIAVGIHDDIGAKLALVKIELQSLRQSVEDENVADSLDRQQTKLEQIIKDVRSLTFELSNPVLYEVGLEAAVESWLKNNIKSQSGINYQFETNNNKSMLDDRIKVTIFNGIRELVTNILKHANAKNIYIYIENNADHIKTIVQDDGIGFDKSNLKEHTTKQGGFGLFSLREKLEYLGGEIQIMTEKGNGTTVTIKVPLDNFSEITA